MHIYVESAHFKSMYWHFDDRRILIEIGWAFKTASEKGSIIHVQFCKLITYLHMS